MSDTYDFIIQQGATFSRVVRWEAPPIIYKAITAITKAAPAALTVTGHGIPDGWRVAVTSVVGMRQINADHTPPTASEYHKATVVDSNTITLNDVNSALYTAYTSGGYVQYNTPVTLTGYTARMQIRATVESTTTLVSLTTENGGITLDNTAKTITLLMTATATAALDWTEAVYDLELVSSGGVVTRLLSGSISVQTEVTR